MNKTNEYLVAQTEIQKRLPELYKRNRILNLWGFLSTSVFIISVVSLFIHQDMIYGFMGMSETVQQLHLPHSLDEVVNVYQHQPDYFFNLISWLGWFILKVFSSVIGAFFIVHFLKKISFFYVRFQSFVLKFVGWLIAVILIWSSLTYVQYDLNDESLEQQYQLSHYDKSIHESQIAVIMTEQQVDPIIQAYVLAQVALMHKPEDTKLATAYLARLAQAERNEKQFVEYGFNAEQLWSMQQQVYGQSITPWAKAIDPRANQARQISEVVKMMFMLLSAIMLLAMFIFFGLARSFKSRIQTITQRLEI